MTKYLFLAVIVLSASCTSGLNRKQTTMEALRETVVTNAAGSGNEITIDLYRGKSFYYPLMAIWLEDQHGSYIQTLYVARSVATGIFRYGKQDKKGWISAPRRAPQTLPYWAHKRGVAASDGLFMPEPSNPVPDAYTGPTPVTGFTVKSKSDNKLQGSLRIMLEINQNWDWNEYWKNDKFPGDEYYSMSCQPAVVYEAVVDAVSPDSSYRMKPIGHSHYSGKTGELFTDLSTLTTALQIADSIVVRIR